MRPDLSQVTYPSGVQQPTLTLASLAALIESFGPPLPSPEERREENAALLRQWLKPPFPCWVDSVERIIPHESEFLPDGECYVVAPVKFGLMRETTCFVYHGKLTAPRGRKGDGDGKG